MLEYPQGVSKRVQTVMAARDKFHDAVKNALLKEDWQIIQDPLFLQFGGVDLYVDLGAEKLITAMKGKRKIAVEVKSFLSLSLITDFHLALGQLLNYRLILARKEPDRSLYLAVPLDAYNAFFKLEFTQAAIQDYQLNLIVYDPQQEIITQWLD